ncbi:hypothetical protein BDR05DRAFT_278853 [Suillus weaverae]|nr:hypothetical protein BDR05DRAFT_278853 [Suillus weaverae]
MRLATLKHPSVLNLIKALEFSLHAGAVVLLSTCCKACPESIMMLYGGCSGMLPLAAKPHGFSMSDECLVWRGFVADFSGFAWALQGKTLFCSGTLPMMYRPNSASHLQKLTNARRRKLYGGLFSKSGDSRVLFMLCR